MSSNNTRPRSISDHIIEVPFAMVPAEASLDSRLTLMHLRVLIAILTFRRKNTDSVCVRREKIAGRCGYQPRTVSKVTSELAALGWLEKIGKGGNSRAVEYRVTVPDLGTVVEDETVPDPGTVEDDSTVPDPGTVRGGSKVPEQGTVPGSGTVPDPGSTTVPGSGQLRFPDRRHAYNRDLTEIDTEVSNTRAHETPAYGVITAGWLPSDDCVRMLEQRGVTRSFIEDAVPEFILYWRERGKPYHAAEWPQKFLGHVKRQWERYLAALNNPNSTPRPIAPDFWPSAETERELTVAGLSSSDIASLVAEFRRYWIERGEARHAWNAKFHEWALQHAARRGDNGSIENRLNDRSWAGL